MHGPLSPAEYEELRTELEQPDRSMSIIGYTLAAFGGGVFTLVCLAVGVWLRGAW